MYVICYISIVHSTNYSILLLTLPVHTRLLNLAVCTDYSLSLHKITQSRCAQITQSFYSILLCTQNYSLPLHNITQSRCAHKITQSRCAQDYSLSLCTRLLNLAVHKITHSRCTRLLNLVVHNSLNLFTQSCCTRLLNHPLD